MATEKSFAHLWLSEGFATYLTHVYIESKYGTDSLNKEMRIDRDQVIAFVKTSHKPVVDSTKDLMELLNANSYQKGSWVLHMLRRELGDTVFRRSIRQYYAQYAGKNAETSDLQKVFENVSGKSLQQFFKQWLFTPENPSLDISWSYDAKNQKVNLHIRQLQNSLFQFPLSFSFSLPSNKKAIHHTIIDKREMDVSFPANSKPSIVIADPSTSLLFEAKISETK
jgi:aminopeptidase N